MIKENRKIRKKKKNTEYGLVMLLIDVRGVLNGEEAIKHVKRIKT